MDMPDYDAFFRSYAAAYVRSLGEEVDTAAIRGFFAEGFVAAGVTGGVNAGSNDAAFDDSLKKGYAFYKAIGTRGMDVERVETQVLCEGHDLARVFYRAHYFRKHDGQRIAIPFDLVYMLQRRTGGPKIFAFIAGDEMGLYRRHGLVDDQGRPS